MALISAQVGFSLLMLIAASLFVRSLVNLRTLDPGFDTRNVVTFAISPELNGYSGERTMDLFRRLRQGLERIPGADAAGLGMVRPLEEDEWDSGVRVEGYQPRRGENMLVYFNATSPGYFRTLEIPILDGRDFEDADGPKTARVAIVNGAFARHYFGDRPAVGRYIAMGGPASAKPDIRIIGVVRDSKYGSLRADISPQVFLPYTQMPFMFGMNGYLRTSLPPEQAAAAIRRVLGEIDPALPVIGMRTLDAQRSRAIAKERLLAWLAMAFGAAAALLTALGLYGVLAYAVSRRTRELGVRIALGAGRSSVIWLVVREALLLWGIGAAVALPTALALGRFLRAELFGVAPGDPWMMAAATLLLALIAALATALPARRAVRIDPVQALQYE
jgi:predicted permease